MTVDIVNFLTSALTTFTGNNIQKRTAIVPVSNNPFANPFVTSEYTKNNYQSYAQNKPVQGGYFAGYYNGRANIVGKRLFVEA